MKDIWWSNLSPSCLDCFSGPHLPPEAATQAQTPHRTSKPLFDSLPSWLIMTYIWPGSLQAPCFSTRAESRCTCTQTHFLWDPSDCSPCEDAVSPCIMKSTAGFLKETDSCEATKCPINGTWFYFLASSNLTWHILPSFDYQWLRFRVSVHRHSRKPSPFGFLLSVFILTQFIWLSLGFWTGVSSLSSLFLATSLSRALDLTLYASSFRLEPVWQTGIHDDWHSLVLLKPWATDQCWNAPLYLN